MAITIAHTANLARRSFISAIATRLSLAAMATFILAISEGVRFQSILLDLSTRAMSISHECKDNLQGFQAVQVMAVTRYHVQVLQEVQVHN